MFKVGDEVIVNDVAHGCYRYTIPGSIGHIVSIQDTTVRVIFHTIPDNLLSTSDPWDFFIDTNHLSLYNPMPIAEKICNKIKSMEERQALRRSY